MDTYEKKLKETLVNGNADYEVTRWIEQTFPELKESEDERIRNFLMMIVDKYAGVSNEEKKKCLAWLEKQGEQNHTALVQPKFKAGDIIRHKELGFTCKITAVDTEYRVSECNGTHLPFDAQDAYELVEQKPAWSEEDENILQGIWDEILANKHNAKEYEWKTYDKFLDWLKSLKPQNNITDEELAQAKKDAYNDALDKIEYHSGEPTFDDGWSAAIWFLKKRNTAPQNTWKPSKRQMKALKEAVDEHFDIDGGALWHLYENLKKLMEE